MLQTPINYNIVSQKIAESGLDDLGIASIREIVRLVNNIENATGQKFVRMEMGVPGLPAPDIGINAEIEALKNGVASKYPMIEGVTELKKETARFAKLFLDIDVNSDYCLPTVGAMQGAMAVFMVANRNDKLKEGTLFIDPGFPVQKAQCKVLGHDYYSFDVYDFRGDKLRDKLESYLKTGKISTILYSNPNNPSWVCLTEHELQIIGDLANKYDTIVIEDLAYFGMDFRKDISEPGVAPFQSTVAKYTQNYVLLISSSKAFSYAGQRIGMLIVSDFLFNRKYPDLRRYYGSDGFGYSLIYGALYALSAGVTHSVQYGLAALLKAVNDKKYNFVDAVQIYGQRAAVLKTIFTTHGFTIVYTKDEDMELADGFYFTIAYPGFSGGQLLKELRYFGIRAISLKITGSTHTEGLRACVSQIYPENYPVLESRLAEFNKIYSSKKLN